MWCCSYSHCKINKSVLIGFKVNDSESVWWLRLKMTGASCSLLSLYGCRVKTDFMGERQRRHVSGEEENLLLGCK